MAEQIAALQLLSIAAHCRMQDAASSKLANVIFVQAPPVPVGKI